MSLFKHLILSLVASASSLFGRQPPVIVIEAEASFYARDYLGKRMANGQPYNPHRYTVATWDFPLGSVVRVEYVSRNGITRSVLCEVTDRGPAKHLAAKGRRFDLSYAAFRVLENPKHGVIRVTTTRIK